MKRTTIWLTAQQTRAIKGVSKKTGMKQAEVIRRAIDAGLQDIEIYRVPKPRRSR